MFGKRMTSIVINEYGGVFLKGNGIGIKICRQAKIFYFLRCVFIITLFKNMFQEGSVLFRCISSFNKICSLVLCIPEVGKYGMIKIGKIKFYSRWKSRISHPLIQIF